MNISIDTLKKWDEHFIPEYDLLFLEEMNIDLPEDILIAPRHEISHHPLLNLDANTFFESWLVPKKAKYVAVIPNDQFEHLDISVQKEILLLQKEYNRGGIYAYSELMRLIEKMPFDDRTYITDLLIPMSFQTDDGPFVALNRKTWTDLTLSFRYAFLKSRVDEYISQPSAWNELQNEEQNNIITQFPQISTIIDTFPENNGPNCFATALSAATTSIENSAWIRNQWIHPEMFLLGLQQRGYQPTNTTNDLRNGTLQQTDILVWKSDAGTPLHASFFVSDTLAFNKDGQTCFNPWQIVQVDDLEVDWREVINDGGIIELYRKRR